jgi:hypothetical protein
MFWFNIIQGGLTLIIATIVAYIAWQQWQLNRTKHRLNLYDRRLKIYQEVKVVLSLVARDTDINFDKLLEFRSNVSEADFLFGPEITEFIGAVYENGLKLHAGNEAYSNATRNGPPSGYDNNKNVSKTTQLLVWYLEQFDKARELFKPYLSLSEKKK